MKHSERRFFIRSSVLACVFSILPIHAENPASADNLDLSKRIQPVLAQSKFSDPEYNIWCGSMVRDAKGTCHLFYSRWPKKLGHYAWVTHSEIARAEADHPLGPYRHAGLVLPPRGKEFWDGLCTHNPTITQFGGKFYLYYMGNTGDGKAVPNGLNWSHRNLQRIGVAVADRPEGPWKRLDKPLLDVTRGFHDALCNNNPAVTIRPDGGVLMVYKAVGDKGNKPFGGPVVHVVATADHPMGPFKKHPTPVFTAAGESFPAEDPFIWWGDGRYLAVVKDFKGHFTGQGPSLALFESANGMDWKLAQHPLVSRVGVQWKDGPWQPLLKLERPQIWLQDGEPAVLFCAAADRPDLNHTWNVAIPLMPVEKIRGK